MSRPYWTTKPDMRGYCVNCSWSQYKRNALALAAKHYDQTGHDVRVEICYVVAYGLHPDHKKLEAG